LQVYPEFIEGHACTFGSAKKQQTLFYKLFQNPMLYRIQGSKSGFMSVLPAIEIKALFINIIFF